MAGPRSLTLILSDSEFLASLEIERLRAHWEKQAYAVEEVPADDLQAVFYALDTPSLLGDGRFVIVRAQAAQLQEATDRIVAWASAPPPGIAAALVMGSATRLRKALGARADVIEVAAPKPWEVPEWIVRFLKGRGRVMTREAAAALVEAVGTDLREVATAAEQLATATTGQIAVETVTRLFRGLESQLYTFLDAIVQRDRAAALRHLGALLRTGEHPLAIHAALVKQFRAIAVAREGDRVPAAVIAKETGVSMGQANRALRNGRAFDASEVRRTFRLLADADLALKGGERGEDQPGELVMELLVADLVGDRSGPVPGRPAARARR